MEDVISGVEARLFAGILVTSEIRMHLNQNGAWKNALIAAASGSDDLIEARHDKKDYVGCYVTEDKVRLNDLKHYEQFVIDKLLTYCPQLPRTSCRFHIFSQLLIH